MNKKQIIQIIITVICTLLIVQYFYHNREDARLLLKFNAQDLTILFLLYVLSTLSYSYRLLAILRSLGLKEIGRWEWFKIFVTSRFVNYHITQGALIYRGIKLKQQYGFSYTKSITTNTFFAWLEQVTIFVLSIILMTFLDPQLEVGGLPVLLFLVMFALGLILVPFVVKSLVKKINLKGEKIEGVLRNSNDLMNYLTNSLADRGLILNITFFNLVSFLLDLIWFAVCFNALDINLTLSKLILFTVGLKLIGSFKIIPGNFGVAEVWGGYLTKILGWDFGSGIIICVIARILGYLTLAILSLISFNPFGIKKAP